LVFEKQINRKNKEQSYKRKQFILVFKLVLVPILTDEGIFPEIGLPHNLVNSVIDWIFVLATSHTLETTHFHQNLCVP
jgi:hypothetical protein